MRLSRSGAAGRRLPVPPRHATFTLILASLLAALGCGGGESPAGAGAQAATPPAEAASAGGETAEDAIAVEIARVSRQSLSAVYATSATLRADKLATVTARTRGVIRELLAEEGDWVERGAPLARLENDEQLITHEQSSAVSATKQRELARAETLHEQGLLSDEAHDTIRREAVEAAHGAELAELALSRTTIRAPFSGRILTRHVDPGATVSDGTAVYDIADLDPLYADVQIPERQVERLRAGQTVRIVADQGGVPTETEARIERIAPAVDPDTGTVKVTVAVPRAASVRPGSFVRVGIVTDTHEDALVVPRSALVAEGRRWHLFRVSESDEGKVELVGVTRGFEEADRVEILATEGDRPLVEGDRVVVTGAPALSDGSTIEILGAAGVGRLERESAEAGEGTTRGSSPEASGAAA